MKRARERERERERESERERAIVLWPTSKRQAFPSPFERCPAAAPSTSSADSSTPTHRHSPTLTLSLTLSASLLRVPGLSATHNGCDKYDSPLSPSLSPLNGSNEAKDGSWR